MFHIHTHTRVDYYLCWEAVTSNGVLTAYSVDESVMQMNFMKLIAITEWTTADIDRLLGFVVHGEDNAVSCIGQNSTHFVLVDM